MAYAKAFPQSFGSQKGHRKDTHHGSDTVLLLEDEFLIALELEEALEDAGFRVLSTSRIEDCLQRLTTITPDAAILDFHCGSATSQPVAEVLADRQVPFVVYSGMPAEDEVVSRVFEDRQWFTKPIDNQTIIAAVKGLLAADHALQLSASSSAETLSRPDLAASLRP